MNLDQAQNTYQGTKHTSGHKTTFTVSRSRLLILYGISKFDTAEQI